MPDAQRRRERSPRLLIVLVALVLSVLAVGPDTAGAGSEAPPAPPDTVVDNEFIPADRDLSECVSAVQKPGCGSKAKGGWRQGAVAGVMVGGLAFIAWRIIRSARRNRPDPAGSSVPNGLGGRR